MSTRSRSRCTRWRRGAVAALAGALLAAGCSSSGDHGAAGPTTTTTTAPGATGGPTGPAPTSSSLALRLSEGHAATGPIDAAAGRRRDRPRRRRHRSTSPTASPPGPTTRPPPPTSTGRRSRRHRPRRAPGSTCRSRPPTATGGPLPDGTPTGPVEVLRHQPDGEVAIAPFASITFNQPMVAVGTVAQVAAADVPATITPAIPGTWQWIGTRTLRFDAAAGAVDRLPMATEFTVTVPAGTRSASGAQLAQAFSFSFATPPVTVQSFTPTEGSLPLQPVFLATFDQLVDPQAVLATVVLQADGDTRAVRLATDAEVAADPAVAPLRGTLADGRWLAFRPVDPLPTDASLTIQIGPGTPSAEGPRTTTEPARYRARTYAPLQATGLRCAWADECPPGTDLLVSFNNPLDPDAFDPASIRLDPPIPGAVIGVSGDVIDIRGATQPRTRYDVTVPQRDPRRVRTGAGRRRHRPRRRSAGPSRSLSPFDQPLITLDPLAAQQSVTVGAIGHDRLHVRAYAVSPDDWPAFTTYVSDVLIRGDTGQLPDWPVVLDTEVDGDATPTASGRSPSTWAAPSAAGPARSSCGSSRPSSTPRAPTSTGATGRRWRGSRRRRSASTPRPTGSASRSGRPICRRARRSPARRCRRPTAPR